MPRGKRSSTVPGPAQILAAAARANAFNVELDTRAELADSIVSAAAAQYQEAIDAGASDEDAMRAVLAPYYAPANPKEWVVARDATVGMYGGPVRFTRGQRLTDHATVLELQRAGVDVRATA